MGIVQTLQRSPYRLFWRRSIPAITSEERPVQNETGVSSQEEHQSDEKQQNSNTMQDRDGTAKQRPDEASVTKSAREDGKLSYEEEKRLVEMQNACENNLNFLGSSVMLYALEHNGNFPLQRGWITALSPYLERAEGVDVAHCPAGGNYKYCARYDYKAGGARMIVYCTVHKLSFCEDGECRKLKRLPQQ